MLLGRSFLTAALALAVQGVAQAQPGTNDPTFNSGDGGNGLGDGPNGGYGDVRAIAVQADGKAVIGGMFTSYNKVARPGLARLLPEGGLDLSFVPQVNFTYPHVTGVAIQADGKVLVTGRTVVGSSSVHHIVRLNVDGSVDPTFSTSSGFNAEVRAVVVQADGKILAGGSFTTYNGASQRGLVRMNADGTVDPTFITGIGFSGTVSSLSLAADGRITVFGDFSNYNTTPCNDLLRLHGNGSVDVVFDMGALSYASSQAAVVLADGSVMVAGYFGTSQVTLKHFNGDGSVAPISMAAAFAGSVGGLVLLPDGKFMARGAFRSVNGTTCRYIARVNADGSFDSAFNVVQPDAYADGNCHALAVVAEGRMLAGGDQVLFREVGRNYLARLNSDGSLGDPYNAGTGFSDKVTSLLIQPDGRIIAGGYFCYYNGQRVERVVRLEPDGTLDPSFQADSFIDRKVTALALLPDGKLLVGGNFHRLGPNSPQTLGPNLLVRLNADGSLDPTFTAPAALMNVSPGTLMYYDMVSAIVVLSDDKVMVGGPSMPLWRLNPDGTRDMTFSPGYSGYTYCMQPDERVVVGWTDLKRLNMNGSVDPSFQGHLGGPPLTPIAHCIVPLANGQVMVSGGFESYNGTPTEELIRVNSDGTLDVSFQPPVGAFAHAIVPRPNGQVLCAGTVGNSNVSTVYLLNADGSVDASLGVDNTIGFGYVGWLGPLKGLAVQADGDIVVAGDFTSYNGTGRNRIARLHGTGLQFVDISAKVLLGGAYDSYTQLMNDGLRSSGVLLTDEPYATLGYEHVGSGASSMNAGVLSVTGNNAIVDWVVVELRDRTDATDIIATRAALLQRDGDVVDLDGVSPVRFEAAPDNYFVSVRHRNHLGVMAAGSFSLGPEARAVDFKHAGTATFGTEARMLTGTRMALWPGDVNFDGLVKYTGSGNDRDPVLTAIGSFTPTNTVSGYRQEDVNMDGTTKYTGNGNDRDRILLTVGSLVPTNTRSQQLP